MQNFKSVPTQMNKIRRTILLTLLPILLLGCQPKEITSAKIYIQKRNWQKAIELLEQAVVTHPNNPEGHFLLGQAYGDQSRYREMKKQFGESLGISPKFQPAILQTIENHWITLYNKGIKAQNDRNFKLAENLLKTAILIDPSKREAYNTLAANYIEANQPRQALLIYEKLLKETPDDINLLIATGNLFYIQKRFDDVVKVLKKVLEIEPDHRDAMANLALSYDSLGKTDEALTAYQKAVKANPLDKDLIFLLGVHHYNRSHFTKAIELFKQVLELSPGEFESTSNIGNAYLSIAEDLRTKIKSLANSTLTAGEIQQLKTEAILTYMKVIPYFKKALEMQPHHPTLWINLGVAYVNSGENEKGQEALLKAEEWKLKLGDESNGQSTQ
ncbi:tetratricopeptide repeat protein [candidate division KSB1 bacterium]|nr:tetratricopeptide repeat protein [candidate division KSB1 bacterium]